MFAISVPIFVLMAIYGHYGKQLESNLGRTAGVDLEKLSKKELKGEPKLPCFTTIERTNFLFCADTLKEGLIVSSSWWSEKPKQFKNLLTNTAPLITIDHVPVLGFLGQYEEITQRRTLVSLTILNKEISFEVRPPELGGNLAAFHFGLASNGLAALEFGTNITFIVAKEEREEVEKILLSIRGDWTDRKRLPDKAPADSTWLSPFGPLTTKAAKAAHLSPEQAKPYSLLYTYSLIIALVCGTAGLPHILVRFYTNPDGVAAKRTTMWVMILIGIFYVFPPVFGVLGRNLMPELYNGLAGVKGTDGIVLKLPTILRERYGVLGSILSGVTCAGAFAAFMSTFSGLLVSMTGALAHDVYGRILRPKSTQEQRLRAFKISAVIIGGVAIVLGCFVEPLEINFMVGQAFAIAAASYFPLLFMSVWWRKMTMRGAATGMLTGGLCALFSVALTNCSNLALDKGPMGKIFSGFAPLNNYWAAHPLLRILCEQPAIWSVPLAITLMIVVSKLTQREVPPDIRMKMLVLHAPEKLGLKQEYIQEHQIEH
jgi:hypothetical protein